MVNKIRKSNVKTYFFTGLLFIIPVALTLWILWIIFHLIGNIFSPLLKAIPVLKIFPDFFITLLSFGFTIVLVGLVGLIGTNLLGKGLLRFIEQNILLKIPLARYIYPSLRQLTNAVVDKRKITFKRVVLIEYPRKGIYTVAFVTNEVKNTIGDNPEGNLFYVFIPTTPNPTSGWFALVPEKEVIPFNISVEEGVKLVISGGIITSPKKEDRNQSKNKEDKI